MAKGSRLSKIFTSLNDCPPDYRKDNRVSKKVINLEGKQYGHLKVIYMTGIKNKRSEWLCLCQNCGRYVIVNSHNLRTGHTKSCGCLISEKLRDDLTGKVFNYLTVLEYDKSINENPYWKVKCNNCGKIYSVSREALVCNNQKSCGCILSPGEKKISEILTKNNINYKTQVTFEGLTGKNNNKLRFDFGIYDKDGSLSHLIEMQGIQHYKNIFNIPEQEYQYRLSLDDKKRKWCQSNSIPLLEIKYDEEITLDKLLIFKTKGIEETDFIQYKKATMFITNTKCSLKCEKECGIKCCSNNKLFQEPTLYPTFNSIIQRYLLNPLTTSITFGGLEHFDEAEQLLLLIHCFRQKTEDDIVIYTGYTEEELKRQKIDPLYRYKNIIIKFGRYVPNQEPHYDEVLGVKLASDNQYARRMS